MAETKVENPDIQVTDKAPEAEMDSQLKVAPKPQSESKGGYWWGTGRRKSSVARVRIKLGDGKKVAKFVKQQGMVGVLAQPLTPFPGTRLFRSLKKQGRILHENWQDYNGKVVFKPKNLTAAELQKEIYDCYRSVYSPLRLAKYILFGKMGSKLGVIGEGLIRYWEWFKCKNYIKDKLAD